MKFKNGDRVRFLNDIGGGLVNRIDQLGKIYVLTEDGFEIPVSEKELVLSRPMNFEAEDTTEKPESIRHSAKQAQSGIAKPVETVPEIARNVSSDSHVNLILGFIPERQGPVFSSSIACYLINDSSYSVYFKAGRKEGGNLYYLSSGFIEADTKNLLTTFNQTELSKISDIHLQIILVSKGLYTYFKPIDKMVNLNPINFSKESYFRENEYFEEKGVLFGLISDNENSGSEWSIPEDVKIQKADRINKPLKKEATTDTLEIDLHYDEISMQNSQLTPSAIMALQMSRFHSAIEEAIGRNMRRLVIIHGVGQGTLKTQIRKELQEKYPKYTFQDASFKEYGFGATMVHLMHE